MISKTSQEKRLLLQESLNRDMFKICVFLTSENVYLLGYFVKRILQKLNIKETSHTISTT